MKVAEVRHLDSLKTNFGIADGNIYSANVILADEHIPAQMIFSNANEFAEGQQYIFDTLWNKAIPAEQKIKEIEEGIPRYETTIMIQPDEIVKRIVLLTETSNRLSICMTSGGLRFSYKYFFETKKKLTDKQKRGEHQGIRYLSYIDNDNIQIVKTFLDAGFQVRHVKNLPPLSFGISDKEAALTIEKMEGGKNIQTFLVSNDPQYVQHFTSIFEELWENGIDARIRIEDIEAGRETDDELADAKRYLNEVLQEVRNMEKITVRSKRES
jgi:hypothetical protein